MILAAAESPHISLTAEPIFHIGPVTINNSMLLGIVGTIILVSLLRYTVKRIEARKYNRLSVAIFWLYEYLLHSAEQVVGDRKRTLELVPLAVTIFMFVLINNWIGLLPFVGEAVTFNGLPLFRGLAADLNFTIGLALITMITAQIYALKTHGFFGNARRYFVNPFKDPIGTFVGFLELIAEFSRLIALSMRLFGNIFGGEVLLVVIALITASAAPLILPAFMALELFVGAVQAYVFFMLTVVFISLGTSTEGHGSEHAPALQASSSH